jgi:DNA-binding transcriptional regulator YiaG
VFDASFNVGMLNALAAQPLQFQRRVVVGVIESHVHLNISDNFNKIFDFSVNGLKPATSKSGFRLVTLPYPTGVTLSIPHATTSSLDERSVLVLFVGSLARGRGSNTGRSGIPNMIRAQVVDAIRASGTQNGKLSYYCTEDACGICAPGNEDPCRRLLQDTEKDRLWELPANAVFCVEPAGDTLTRAHFYVAVHSGCIPIIFDGGDGSSLYDKQSHTFWPFRVIGNDDDEENASSSRSSSSSGSSSKHDSEFDSFNDGSLEEDREEDVDILKRVKESSHVKSSSKNSFFISSSTFSKSNPSSISMKSSKSSSSSNQLHHKTITNTNFDIAIEKIGLDYSKFSILLNATEVLMNTGNKQQSSPSYVDRLIDMYVNRRDQVHKYQVELDKVAQAFVYSPATTLRQPVSNDAFGRFSTLLHSLISPSPSPFK